jgi:hypothetical protein
VDAVAVAEQAEDEWLVLSYGDNPTVRLDCTVLDRIFADGSSMVLSLEKTMVTLPIEAGPLHALNLAERLSIYTRSAPITTPRAYEQHKRRLAAATDPTSTPEPCLWFGVEAVQLRGDLLCVGDVAFRAAEVEAYGIAGALLPLPGGMLQAGLAVLAMEATFRVENAGLLAQRIAEYEARVNSSPDGSYG